MLICVSFFFNKTKKRNFPTNSNLDKKIKLDNEKIERGITLETRQFGYWIEKCIKRGKF
jgi:hypothetical protein